MLLLLGIDSAFSLVEGAASALVEKLRISHASITFLLCVTGFVLGLLFCTQAGIHWVGWADHICNDIGLPLVMLLQCIVAGWLFERGIGLPFWFFVVGMAVCLVVGLLIYRSGNPPAAAAALAEE